MPTVEISPRSRGARLRRRRQLSRWTGWAALIALVVGLAGCVSGGPWSGGVAGPVVFFDFENPVPGDSARELDIGPSGTTLSLINGGGAMRVRDGAHRGSTYSLQTRQVNPTTPGNDDWKAGVYSEEGVATLAPFNAVRGVTIMGWVKPTGPNPGFNTNTPDPEDRYNAVGLMGILSGTSTGHDVRALLELISVADTLRLVALGRRVDEGRSQTFAAREPWQELLPMNEWTFLAATFDFERGAMALFRNGRPLDGFYVQPGDPWEIEAAPGPVRTSATDPRGIKIGGSFPQNTLERNPFNGRFDDLMFFDRALTPAEVLRHYQQVTP